ncbi:MAG: hypothetical protein DRK00_07055 [Thermoprotei archaeon]|nr:MAG: hypothetical protein DRK00_07055 [Thermoprotei archaeon]
MIPLFRVVDSRIEISSSLQLYCLDGTWTYSHVPDVPVLLVSPETMDEVCPPERRIGISPDCVGRLREAAGATAERLYRERGEDWRRALEEFWSLVRRCEKPYAARGAFIERCRQLGVEGPAILVCPERIRDAGKASAEALRIGAGRAFRRTLRATLVHEQVHAYTWRASRGAAYREYGASPSARVVEEFIAQYTAWAHLDGVGKALLARQATTQPLEYRTWRLMTTVRHPHRLASFAIARLWSSAASGRPALEPLVLELRRMLPYWRYVSLIPPFLEPHDLRRRVDWAAYTLLRLTL